MYDAIVVGARCAGSPTAMLLAHRGYKVLLLDKATFPSDTMSTHFIQTSGLERLQRWGLMDRLDALDTPTIPTLTLDLGDFTLTGTPPSDEVQGFRAPRRYLLDKMLLDAAIEAGVEFREGFTVKELISDRGRVIGVRGKNGGPNVCEEARIVIGADGLHSQVAKHVEAETYNEKPVLSCGYYSYWSGLDEKGAVFYPRDGSTVITFPTNDGLSIVLVMRRRSDFDAFRKDIEGVFTLTTEQLPWLADKLRSAKREERFIGTADLPNYFRKPFGPGWALVGDAGYHKDPVTGEGISDAWRDAEYLVDALGHGFACHTPCHEALEAYEKRRNVAAEPVYGLTTQFATMDPAPPPIQAIFRALHESGDQVQTNRLFGTLAGTVPVADFFAPANVQQILAAAA
jgi:flavin-dependent dehydrogenase